LKTSFRLSVFILIVLLCSRNIYILVLFNIFNRLLYDNETKKKKKYADKINFRRKRKSQKSLNNHFINLKWYELRSLMTVEWIFFNILKIFLSDRFLSKQDHDRTRKLSWIFEMFYGKKTNNNVQYSHFYCRWILSDKCWILELSHNRSLCWILPLYLIISYRNTKP